MRITILAAIAAAGLLPGAAQASGHTERARAADVRVHSAPVRSASAAHAGTTWSAPTTGTRESYRRDREAPLYADEGYGGDQDGDDAYLPGYDPDRDDANAYGVEDHAMSDRFVRDDDGHLDYDRDYPYDAPYGNYGGGYYMVVETTTTTGPSVVTYAEEEKVAVHRARRTLKKRRAYRTSASKSCYCK